jgi:hypothetical protein
MRYRPGTLGFSFARTAESTESLNEPAVLAEIDDTSCPIRRRLHRCPVVAPVKCDRPVSAMQQRRCPRGAPFLPAGSDAAYQRSTLPLANELGIR